MAALEAGPWPAPQRRRPHKTEQIEAVPFFAGGSSAMKKSDLAGAAGGPGELVPEMLCAVAKREHA